jgi:hypothetical protein
MGLVIRVWGPGIYALAVLLSPHAVTYSLPTARVDKLPGLVRCTV